MEQRLQRDLTPNSPQRRRFLAQFALLAAAGAGPARAADFEVTRWPADEPAPPLQSADLTGQVWRLADLRGRAVLLNFWASWCPPCRAEMPSLQDMAAIYGADRIVVLAINFKESRTTAARFAQASALSLPVLMDPDGSIARAWGARVFPTTVLIDSTGQPRQRIRGEVEWGSLAAERLIAPLLAPAPPLRS